MSDPARLRDEGSDAQRALLRSAPPTFPEGLQERIRLRVERKIGSRSLRLKATGWSLASALLLVAGGAMAYGIVAQRTRWLEPIVAQPQIPHAESSRVRGLPAQRDIESDAADNDSVQQKPLRKRHRLEHGPSPAAPVKLAVVDPPVQTPLPEPSPSIGEPAPSLRGLFLEGAAGEEPPAAAPPEAPQPLQGKKPGRFLVHWDGHRSASLDVLEMPASADDNSDHDGLARIHGTVNRTALSVEVRRRLLLGKIGGEVINIWLKGDETAEGSIAGYPVSFTVLPTHNGYLLRGSLPGHTARLEVRKGILRWYPGCENALAATGAGVYQGTCAEGKMASVVLPPAFRQLPPLPRLVMLAIVLTERDPVFRHRDPQLFNLTP